MNARYFVFLGICLFGIAIRTGYEHLKKRGKLNPKNKAVFAIVFAAMVTMLSSWVFMCPIDPLRIRLPGNANFAGLVLLMTGLITAFAGLIQLRGVENVDHLVTNGIFSKIRHPMYTGFILWIVGWIIYYGAAISLVIGLLCIGNILYWRRLEEERMESDYGDQYLKYCARTWF